MSGQPTTLEFLVRYSSAAYNTGRVLGQSASSTMSAEAAAQRLADKLFGAVRGPVVCLGEQSYMVTRFQASGVLLEALTCQAARPPRGGSGLVLLKAWGYTTGHSAANGQPRCSNCAHVGPAKGRAGKQHGRHCGLHGAPVKTHGVCKGHQAAYLSQNSAAS